MAKQLDLDYRNGYKEGLRFALRLIREEQKAQHSGEPDRFSELVAAIKEELNHTR